MYKSPVSLAVSTAIALSASGLQVASAQQQSVEEVVVTGSRIKRENIEAAALPVTVITREQIEESGDTSVADFVRDLPFNSFGSARQRSGSSAQSFAGVSLRGLGEGRTLILIDGRRAPVAPNVGNAQDLNSIPLAAVERIEFITTGASAIYGSDAVGGVMNIITRKDFNGVQISVGASDPERAGGATEEGSLIFGISGDRGSLLAGVSYNHRDIIFQRERDYSGVPGASTFSNNLLTSRPAPGTLYGFTLRAFAANPTFGSAVPGGCSERGFYTSGSGAGQRCFYDFALEGAYEAEVGNTALFARGQYEINDDWSTYLNTQVSRTESFGRYAPVPSSPWPGGAIFLPVGSPNHPAVKFPTAGYDATEPYFLRHRFAALGNRDTNTDANNYLIDWGVDGSIGNFDINAGVRRTDAQYYDFGRNYVVGGLAQQQIASGAYDIYNPSGNPRTVLDSMIATINRDATYLSKEMYATVTTDLFEMAGGTAGLAVGGEYRDESYQDIYDTLSSSGQIVGSAGNSAFGGRQVKSFYAEAVLPVLSSVEATLAVRHDSYSDYGSDTSPQVAVRWTPIDSLTLRASYGEGFRAPSLDITSAQPAFSAATISDPRTCTAFGLAPTCSTQVTTYSIANPNLESEQSEQYSFGVVWDPTDWVRVRVDYGNIELQNQVSFVGISTIVRCLEQGTGLCPSGLSFLPADVNPPVAANGLGFVRSPDGDIVYGQTGYANLGFTETDFVDLNVRLNYDFGKVGRLSSELLYSRTLNSSGASGVDITDDVGVPKDRAVLSNVWRWGDFSLGWNINYIASTRSSQGNLINSGGTDYGYATRLPSWVTHDVQLNWEAPWNGRLTIGAQNVEDKDPVVDPFDPTGQGYDQALYNGYGRVLYFRIVQNL